MDKLYLNNKVIQIHSNNKIFRAMGKISNKTETLSHSKIRYPTIQNKIEYIKYAKFNIKAASDAASGRVLISILLEALKAALRNAAKFE